MYGCVSQVYLAGSRQATAGGEVVQRVTDRSTLSSGLHDPHVKEDG